MILNRQQFSNFWGHLRPAGLWVPEQAFGRRKSRYFVMIKTINIRNEEFWQWCDENCRGQVLCYSSSSKYEWYGLTHKKDIAWFLLRWG